MPPWPHFRGMLRGEDLRESLNDRNSHRYCKRNYLHDEFLIIISSFCHGFDFQASSRIDKSKKPLYFTGSLVTQFLFAGARRSCGLLLLSSLFILNLHYIFFLYLDFPCNLRVFLLPLPLLYWISSCDTKNLLLGQYGLHNSMMLQCYCLIASRNFKLSLSLLNYS